MSKEVFKHIITKRTHLEKPDDFNSYQKSIRVTEDDSIPFIPTGFGYSQGYRIDLTSSVNFYANQAEFHDATKAAKERLVYEYYKGTFEFLHEMKNALYAGDKRKAFAVIADFEKSIQESLDI
jgi:hypothetical protein